MRTLVALAVCVSVVGCKAGASGCSGSTAPKETEAQTPSSQPAAVPTLDGDYFFVSKVFVYDPMTGEDVDDGEVVDVLSVEMRPDGAIHVKILVVGHNYSECSFDQMMTASGPQEWRWKGGDMYPECEVVLVETPTALVISSNWDCYQEFCGNRVTLEGTFPLSSRKPLGSYEWQDL